MTGKTVLRTECMYCHCFMGETDGKGAMGVSHSICRKCWQEHYDFPYPEEVKKDK